MTFKTLAKTLAAQVGLIAPVMAISVAMPTAVQAFDLVPQQEGEVALKGETCSECIVLDAIVESVESLEDSSTGTKSRLFVDKYATANDYGKVKFKAEDAGTNDTAGAYWFRPVAIKRDGSAYQGGKLEVGTFKFVFSRVIESLVVSWFDTEKSNTTSYIAAVETSTGSEEFQGYVPRGGDKSIFTQEFNNVKSITLDLGEKRGNDGVNFRAEVEPVPEPSIMLGAAGAAVMGGIARRKQRQQQSEG